MSVMRALVAVAVVALGACTFKAGGVATDGKSPDSPRDTRGVGSDGGGGDGSGSAAPTARQGFDVVSGGGRLQAGAITIDVEIGTAVPISRISAGSISIEGAPTVVP
jgi:hypothetical protein